MFTELRPTYHGLTIAASLTKVRAPDHISHRLSVYRASPTPTAPVLVDAQCEGSRRRAGGVRVSTRLGRVRWLAIRGLRILWLSIWRLSV